ncbi:MAG TPA: SpoIIE family protein phosphatase, partial [Bacteroidia bacterium]|nr:SpoIIE family protein phosphatase [Bacteroidia bacterium]
NKLYKKVTLGIKGFIVSEKTRVQGRLKSKSTIIAILISLLYFWFVGYGTQEQQHKATYLFIMFWILMMAYTLRKTERANLLISTQKKEIEQKNKDILDSITYAKRLQDAILPPLSAIKQYLPESFVFYKPKDIVAGDFYWMEKSGDTIFIAAADCTGHGVPGAMVSVVCSTALNRALKEFNIRETGKILDKARELVLETFEKSEDNVQDGMDISLAAISYQPTANSFSLQWSGAYNSLWYVHDGKVIEVAADKQPIGKVDKPVAFTTHNLALHKGDTLYLFTDGYADQFGGLKGKKFKYKQLQKLLQTNAGKPLEAQKAILESTLNEWKGNLEQVDDILVIGIQV